MFTTFSRASKFNYSNLHDEDKKIADELINMIFEINKMKLFYIKSDEYSTEKNLANKLKLEGLEVATRNAVDTAIEFIVHTISQYEEENEEIQEIETKDHFYGADYPETLFEGLAILSDPRFSIKISMLHKDGK